MSVRIITDSASDMSPAEHPALAVLPLSVTFGTDVYMDGVDIDHQRFYEMLVERDELPKTGQVNPYAFSQAIAEVREAGDEAVIITVGAKLSGTNQSARTALAEAPGGDVYVVDSNNVTLGERQRHGKVDAARLFDLLVEQVTTVLGTARLTQLHDQAILGGHNRLHVE